MKVFTYLSLIATVCPVTIIHDGDSDSVWSVEAAGESSGPNYCVEIIIQCSMSF